MGSSHDSGRWMCPRCFSTFRWATRSDGEVIDDHERLCTTNAQRIANEGKAKEKKDAEKKAAIERAKLTNPDFGTW